VERFSRLGESVLSPSCFVRNLLKVCSRSDGVCWAGGGRRADSRGGKRAPAQPWRDCHEMTGIIGIHFKQPRRKHLLCPLLTSYLKQEQQRYLSGSSTPQQTTTAVYLSATDKRQSTQSLTQVCHSFSHVHHNIFISFNFSPWTGSGKKKKQRQDGYRFEGRSWYGPPGSLLLDAPRRHEYQSSVEHSSRRVRPTVHRVPPQVASESLPRQ